VTVEVPLADPPGVIPGAVQFVGDAVPIVRQADVIDEQAVGQRVLAGDQAGPRRRADRAVGDVGVEVDRLPGEAVEVRGFDVRIARVAGGVGAPLVGKDVDKVGSVGHAAKFSGRSKIAGLRTGSAREAAICDRPLNSGDRLPRRQSVVFSIPAAQNY